MNFVLAVVVPFGLTGMFLWSEWDKDRRSWRAEGLPNCSPRPRDRDNGPRWVLGGVAVYFALIILLSFV
jgi:hypothetical protein